MTACLRHFSSAVADDVERLLTDLDDVMPMFEGSTILVTGASGFLMSYIVDTIMGWNDRTDHPCRVLAIDNHMSGLPTRLAHLEGRPNFTFIRHDVSEPLALSERVDWIVHGASIASPPFYRQYPLETIRANVDGTRHMLELAEEHGVRGVIVMSTSEIYGDPEPHAIPTPENYRGFVSSTGPRACYDESKRLAETLSVTFHRLFGTPVKLIRPFNVYGPGLRIDDRRVLPDMISCVLEDRPIELLSDGSPTRSFCYVSDAVALMLRVLTSDIAGEPINVGNDEVEISMFDLAQLVARVGSNVLERPAIPVVKKRSEEADYLVDNPQRRCPDLTFARSRFPRWKPKVTLEDGVKRLLRHYVEQKQGEPAVHVAA